MSDDAKRKWPWWVGGISALPILFMADNFLGPALSGNAVQAAFSKAVIVATEPMFEKVNARLERMDRRLERIERRCREGQ